MAFAHPSDLVSEAKKVACLDELQGYEFGNNQPKRLADMIQVQDSKGNMFAWDGTEIMKYSVSKANGQVSFHREHAVWKREASTDRQSGKVVSSFATSDLDSVLSWLITKSMSSFATNFEKSGYRIGKNGAIGRNFHISKILNACAEVKGPRVPLRQIVTLPTGSKKKVSKLVTLEQYRRFAFALRPALADQQWASNGRKLKTVQGAQ